MDYERKKKIVMDEVLKRFEGTPWPKLEKASDAALDALKEGMTMLDAVKVAERYIESR